MSNIFMSTENSKTNDHNRFILLFYRQNRS